MLSSHHRSKEVTQEIRQWLRSGSVVGSSRKTEKWLYRVENRNELFLKEEGDTPCPAESWDAYQRRFWLPEPSEKRDEEFSFTHDQRQVCLQYRDDDRPSFELRCDGVVVDDLLGTIGLIQFCNPTKADSKSDRDHRQIDPFVLQAVREAVGLRHELLRDSQDARSHFVELVLVVMSNDPIEVQRVGQTLRDLMVRSDYLHNIGVNVLATSSNQKFVNLANDSFERAFCWLMPKSQLWFDQLTEREDPRRKRKRVAEKALSPVSSLASLELNNFRLGGKRTWKLSDQRLHLVHGLNGSGKSSLVEALELLLTNRIERLERNTPPGEVDYEKVLKYQKSPSGVRAEVKALFVRDQASLGLDGVVTARELDVTPSDNRESRSLSVEIETKWREEESDYCAGSFRLEQRAADLLSQSSKQERAIALIASFFPEVDKERNNRKGLTQQIQTSAGKLLDLLDAQDGDQSELGWLYSLSDGNTDQKELKNALSWLRAFQPGSDNLSNILRLLCPAPQELKQILQKISRDQFAAFQSQLSDAESSARRKAAVQRVTSEILEWISIQADKAHELDRALLVVEQLLEWDAGSGRMRGSAMELVQKVDQWLDSHAQADLMARVDALQRTVEESESNSDRLAVSQFLMTETTRNVRQELARELSDRAETLWSEIRDFREGREKSPAPVSKPQITREQLQLCDQFIHSQPLFSIVADEALKENTHHSGIFESRSFTVGIPNDSALTAIRDRLSDRMQNIARLSEMPIRKVTEPQQVFRSIKALRSSIEELQKLKNNAIDTLQDQLKGDTPLAMAINELVALLTPARWAYGKLLPEGDVSSDKPLIDIKVGDNPADEILNTAELNTMALTLFLLCAPRVENPLGMLVLDDPFQNMDELTVTTVARGLSRLLNLWSTYSEKYRFLAELRLAVFLHSIDDVQRFRLEAPCGVYLLPWLTPDHQSSEAHSATDDIRHSPSQLADEIAVPNLQVVDLES